MEAMNMKDVRASGSPIADFLLQEIYDNMEHIVCRCLQTGKIFQNGNFRLSFYFGTHRKRIELQAIAIGENREVLCHDVTDIPGPWNTYVHNIVLKARQEVNQIESNNQIDEKYHKELKELFMVSLTEKDRLLIPKEESWT